MKKISLLLFLLYSPSLYPAAQETKRKRATASPGPAISLSVPQPSIAAARKQTPQEQALAAFKDDHAQLIQTIRDEAQKFIDSLRKDPETGARRRISYAKDLDALKQYLREQFQDQILKTNLAADLLDLLINQQAEQALAVYNQPLITDIEQLMELLPEETQQDIVFPFASLSMAEMVGIFGYQEIEMIKPFEVPFEAPLPRGMVAPTLAFNQQNGAIYLLPEHNTNNYRTYIRETNRDRWLPTKQLLTSSFLPSLSSNGTVAFIYPTQNSIQAMQRNKENIWHRMGNEIPLPAMANWIRKAFNDDGTLFALYYDENLSIYRYNEEQNDWVNEATILVDQETLTTFKMSTNKNIDIIYLQFRYGMGVGDNITQIYIKEGNDWILNKSISYRGNCLVNDDISLVVYNTTDGIMHTEQRTGINWEPLTTYPNPDLDPVPEILSGNGHVLLYSWYPPKHVIPLIPQGIRPQLHHFARLYNSSWQDLQLSDKRQLFAPELVSMNFDGSIIFHNRSPGFGINLYLAQSNTTLALNHNFPIQPRRKVQITNDGSTFFIIDINLNFHHYSLPVAQIRNLSTQQFLLLRDLYKASQQGVVLLTPEQEKQFKALPLSTDLKQQIKNRLRLIAASNKTVPLLNYLNRIDVTPHLTDAEIERFLKIKYQRYRDAWIKKKQQLIARAKKLWPSEQIKIEKEKAEKAGISFEQWIKEQEKQRTKLQILQELREQEKRRTKLQILQELRDSWAGI